VQAGEALGQAGPAPVGSWELPDRADRQECSWPSHPQPRLAPGGCTPRLGGVVHVKLNRAPRPASPAPRKPSAHAALIVCFPRRRPSVHAVVCAGCRRWQGGLRKQGMAWCRGRAGRWASFHPGFPCLCHSGATRFRGRYSVLAPRKAAPPDWLVRVLPPLPPTARATRVIRSHRTGSTGPGRAHSLRGVLTGKCGRRAAEDPGGWPLRRFSGSWAPPTWPKLLPGRYPAPRSPLPPTGCANHPSRTRPNFAVFFIAGAARTAWPHLPPPERRCSLLSVPTWAGPNARTALASKAASWPRKRVAPHRAPGTCRPMLGRSALRPASASWRRWSATRSCISLWTPGGTMSKAPGPSRSACPGRNDLTPRSRLRHRSSPAPR